MPGTVIPSRQVLLGSALLPVLAALASCTVSCVSAARHEKVLAERDRLRLMNLELRRQLAEERVRREEAMDAVAALQGTRHGPVRGEEDRVSPSPAPSQAPPEVRPPPPADPAGIVEEDLRGEPSPDPGDQAGEAGVLKVARHYNSRGKRRQAMDAYTRLINDFPFSTHLPEAFLERGKLRRAAGDLDGALSDFDTVVEAFPRAAEAAEARRQASALRGH